MTLRLPSPRWLDNNFDRLLTEEPELMQAYRLPDYPEPKGDIAKATLSAAGHEFAELRRSKNGIALQQLPGGNATLATAEALRLRLLQDDGKSVLQAWVTVLSRYNVEHASKT